ncbi:hypothetical protein BpHYR1_023860 [Brachionus plicatilis]|uniref:Uncharacterized protein n=1 Tax=Brachionus plicatilis TaxID=10195 RepID=A0A3M7RVV0_BRAPC|nr:hypothetical protein BpHYR1_023860 [Brachionus plicatilis]
MKSQCSIPLISLFLKKSNKVVSIKKEHCTKASKQLDCNQSEQAVIIFFGVYFCKNLTIKNNSLRINL